jgi:uncharacterized protein (TIGR03435 family)
VVRLHAVSGNPKELNEMKAAITILCLTAGAALAQSNRPEFEVATVRPFAPQTKDGKLVMIGSEGDPGMVRMMAMSLHDLVRQAYHVKDYQVDGPAWTTTERYDITAKIPPGTTPETQRLMEQNLLADRFHLTIHREQSKEMQVYALVVGKNGLKVQPVPANRPGPGGFTRFRGLGHIECVKISFSSFADMISRYVDHPVHDRTDVNDVFDFKLDFAMDPALMTIPGMATKAAAEMKASGRDESELPSIFTAVQTLGLRLEPKKEPMDVIVIDHADKTPTEN